jgi:hypothetical protein
LSVNEAPPTRRRWFQFDLETMLLLAALIVVSAFAVREHRERRRLDEENAVLVEAIEGQNTSANEMAALVGKLDGELRKLNREGRARMEATRKEIQAFLEKNLEGQATSIQRH